ncbi:pyridoxine/pyridoxamine 5'-phosphate oxidase-like [Anopheles arabiensis]|uniref:pyridoxal 5'-phosphate synthase n=5 Tax=gambiae species complex TaxID=44542 RepID=Q7QK95_ANOGA|nr:pyridoxine/pyridoxamine 5'-phosphate oxidase-like [Anopheles arabiensis]XP_040229570.1 pyridoxine/pyridoxamine 5'-phosphate oxidase-like [Anopheles coluzzii]XP_041786141.1 pyridoxine/pyridoxamine 5'-phosphate oxidase-like [Anopheles merus]XP_307957.5 pyridoxine/pyridoxamine 5'-phosphate oxidase [Anopheles gambiae]EAA03810.5 AGAP002227-PA [Anopheles gambiae str. PEST]
MRLTLLRRMSFVDLASLRIKYKSEKEIFLESSIERKEPISLFRKWMQDAVETPEIIEPNAMCLATATKDAVPSARFVLLKDVTEEGFTFFTNYESRKADELAENPNVALAFYWLPLRRSVRIEGTAERISREASETYFHQRPRASQIGALASPQSQPIPSREFLDKKEKAIKEELGPDTEVPLPNWGGYMVRPKAIEFWQGQTNRLHDRIRFRKALKEGEAVDGTLLHQGEEGWVYERLAP